MGRSVAGDGGVDVEGPAVDAAAEVEDAIEAGALEEAGALKAAHSVVAVHDDVGTAPVVEFVEALDEFTEGDESGAGQFGQGVFFGLTDVEQPGGLRAVEALGEIGGVEVLDHGRP